MKRSIQVLALFSVVILGSTVLWAQPGFGSPVQVSGTQVQQCPNDANGDGLCDDCGQPVGTHCNQGKGKGKGPGDGSGNQGQGPKDGSGYGSGSGNGNGNCDGTGPRGNQGNRGNRGGRGGRR
ncbi:MAG: hypothetical protein EHM23_07670 [Acidobacteria bacterium]|nr:MAG: hypothetical protein EHM23_07670 [Acidobacteriota bacterium]